MEPQTKRTLIATLACIVVLFGWLKLQELWYPLPAAPTSAPATQEALAPQAAGVEKDGVPPAPNLPPANIAAAPIAAIGSDSAQSVLLGDSQRPDKRKGVDNPWEMAVLVDPRGAGIDSIRLSGHRNSVPRDRRTPGEDPYDLVAPIDDPKTGVRRISFAIEKVRLVEEKRDVDLSNVEWSLEKKSEGDFESAIARTTIRAGEQPILALTRTWRLRQGDLHLGQDVAVTNLSATPRKVILFAGGPIGFRNEDPQRDARRLVTALVSYEKDQGGKPKKDPQGRVIQTVGLGETVMHADLVKAEGASRELKFGEQHPLWTAVGNKYFACISIWLPPVGSDLLSGDYLGQERALIASAEPRTTDDLYAPSDLTFEQVLSPDEPIPPGKTLSLRGEVYCGPKSDAIFNDAARLPEAKARHYAIVTQPDRAGCTFPIITDLMLWLLDNIYRFTGNYGLAIIILVIIVRGVLHPISKSGQIRMMRMQKQMASMKPKLDVIQEQYKNDKQKLNEEMMKLYREHGVSPAGQMLGCLPMLLQMPIWVALWTTLNTNVGMRHAPFFGWIRDLSAPDAFYNPSPPWNLHLPLIGMLTGPIHAFNLLPIIMAITMYAQQKLTQKLTRPATPIKPLVDAQGNPVPDQMAQQQKMMNFMMIFFGFMFYNFPSGLNLYILSSNLLGMAEQWLIRKHIREKEARGDFAPRPQTPKSGGPSLWERLQKRAEDARLAQSASADQLAKKRKKQPRF